MGDLSSKFTREDLETLLEAMGDWEMIGNQEFHILTMIKNAPMPPEDHEAHEAMQQIKEHFQNREREIMRSRDVRQEKAVFLKAKLMLVRKDLGINQLFDMATVTDPDSPMPEKREAKIEVKPSKPRPESNGKLVKSEVAVLKRRLELAEFFINDLGVAEHYAKFLADKDAEKVEKSEEKPTE